MPRNVRNFYMKAEIDGRSGISTGPRASNGEMFLDLFIRDRGSVETVGEIDCTCERGCLRIIFRPSNGKEPILLAETNRDEPRR